MVSVARVVKLVKPQAGRHEKYARHMRAGYGVGSARLRNSTEAMRQVGRDISGGTQLKTAQV